ncbi:ABC transporter-like [Parasponia andersonii]|uniref:ABC transporter-like n=1 Tax=Parasponia andersonii TaxID=3476 RepID=A0A2P5CZH7_PARAD|nr:ABC transporter-like [Parasponia andersonii]
MEIGNVDRGGNSLQGSSSSLRRNNNMEVISRSSREEDDEDAHRWSALEKLPTYSRLRNCVLTTSKGEASEIDIHNLGLKEAEDLLESLVRVAEEDNERFLLKLRNRIDRVGVNLPTIEVRFEHVNVEAEAYVGSRGLPSLINFFTNILKSLLGFLPIFKNKKQHLTILQDVSGVIKPGRMTLLLGPPSSGKTTLLLALAGRLASDLKVSGNVTYNGHGMNEFVPQRTAAYISQHDVHIGKMTVRETLAFSAT